MVKQFDHKTLQTMGHPLMCWDICAVGKQRRLEFANDLERLKEINAKGKWNNIIVCPENALIWKNKILLVTDIDLRIIFATQNMKAMNGYEAEETFGNTPRMFQGPATETNEKLKIKLALENKMPFEAIVTNYKKDGSIYKCRIKGFPICNKSGIVVNYLALENVA